MSKPAAAPVAKEADANSSQPAPRIVKRRNGGLSTPSIKRALKGEFDDEKQISAKEQHELYSKAGETNPFTEEQLKEKWDAFLPRVEDRPSIKATLSVLPKIMDDFSLLLEIDNRIQDEMLAEIRPELVSYLRKELRNSNINLKTLVTEIKREKIIYSDIEKYQAMAERNPNLALLKRTLNLDF
ncbi:hypothetical protein INQ51_11220 [Maribellus sp. CM-23]|uniref:hypothetical protein n=1 Tax=Maribellus sp. CM-23 TaxID=2781026 RepID=UPI001F20370E|nr:hypothetical protein [Maribellus sp. CM-23]MCE4564879.1 hypothetical protein [Maribellus sp. CM-23]